MWKWMTMALLGLGLAFYAGRITAPHTAAAPVPASEEFSPTIQSTDPASSRSSQSSFGAPSTTLISDQQVNAEALDSTSSLQSYQRLLEQLNMADKHQLTELFNRLAESYRATPTSEFPLVLTIMRLAELDPEKALALATKQDVHPAISGAGLSVVLEIWAQQDNQAAYNWIDSQLSQTIPGRAEYSKMQHGLGIVLGQMAKNDPAKAAGILHSLIANGISITPSFSTSLVTQLGDTSNIKAAIREFELAGLDSNATVSMVWQWARRSPQEVADWLDYEVPSDQVDQYVPAIATPWMRQQPEKAGVWLMEHSTPQNVQQRVEVIVRNWTGATPQATLAWLDQQTAEGIDQQRSLQALFGHHIYHDPEFVAEHLERLTNPETKHRVAYMAYANMRRTDESAAEKFLMSSPFQAKIQEQIRERANIQAQIQESRKKGDKLIPDCICS